MSIVPGHTDALDYKGISLASLGKNEEAITYFDKALAIYPGDIHYLVTNSLDFPCSCILVNKGMALIALDKYSEAIVQFDHALQLNPSDTTAMYNKALALGELGKYEEAISYYNQVLSIEPDNKNASQSIMEASSNLRD